MPAAVSADGITLMKVAQALDNFALVSRTRAFVGWDSSPVCTWTGVTCSAQQSGKLIGVNFTQALPPSQPAQPNVGHNIMLTGTFWACFPIPPLQGSLDIKIETSAHPQCQARESGSCVEVLTLHVRPVDCETSQLPGSG